MVSKSRGKKTGTRAGTTRKAKSTSIANDALTSSAAVALAEPELPVPASSVVELPSDVTLIQESPASESVAAAAPTPVQPDTVTAKAPRRKARRKTADAPSATAVETAPTPPKRSRSRKTSPKASPEASPEASTESSLEASPITSAEAEADDHGDARFADALAGAFLYVPDDEPETASPADEQQSAVATDVPAAVEPTITETAITQSSPAEQSASDDPTDDPSDAGAGPSMDLPFIVDIPREVSIVEDAPVDVWVDQILEPTKAAAPVRPPRPKASVARPTGRPTARPTAKPFAKPIAKPAAKQTAKSKGGSAPAATPAASAAAALEPVSGTRWWLVAPVFVVLAVILFMNRPGKKHAPVPDGVLGQWTTAFWLYEHQTLEIKPDTIVATLDEPEEGRYPITKVETSDAGRETSVKITYRNANGDEKVLDFLADKDPTTALRFRAHTGLVWVRDE